MPINILTVTGEDFFINDDLMPLREFWEREYCKYQNHVETIVLKKDGTGYPTIFLKNNIVSIRDLPVQDMRDKGYEL